MAIRKMIGSRERPGMSVPVPEAEDLARSSDPRRTIQV